MIAPQICITICSHACMLKQVKQQQNGNHKHEKIYRDPNVGIFNKSYKIPNEHQNTLHQIIKRF